MERMSIKGRYLIPDWPSPENVKACVTLSVREGKKDSTRSDYTTFNMSTGSVRSEQELSVALANRSLMAGDWQWLARPQWLIEMNGTRAVQAEPDGVDREGDAVWTDRLGIPCAVLSADCVPVIFCNHSGTKVAAAHAGWRGLAGGVLEATVDAIGDPPHQLMAWLGPAISQAHFEVGPEVREAFVSVDGGAVTAFIPGKGDRWHGDLFALARMRLEKKGVVQVYGGGLCTYSEPEYWFSYRRDGANKGNFATVVWLESP